MIGGRRYVVGALLVAVVWLVPGAPAARIEVPRNDGWVTDLAGMLTGAQERELETLMQSYKDGSGHEIALLTIPSLGGEPIERYALEVGRAWRMGERDEHNAALLLVARDDRKIRIEVARGLEDRLTDSISGRIIRNIIVPRFKQDRMYDGLREGIVAMHLAAGGVYDTIPEDGGGGSSGAAGLLPVLILLIVLFQLLRAGGRTGCLPWLALGMLDGRRGRSRGYHGGWSAGRSGGGGFGGFGGGGGFSGGGASGGW